MNFLFIYFFAVFDDNNCFFSLSLSLQIRMDLLNLKSLFGHYQWRREEIWMRNFNVNGIKLNSISPPPPTNLLFIHFFLNFISGAFKLYDVDNDGFITRTEMYNIVDAIYQMVVKFHFPSCFCFCFFLFSLKKSKTLKVVLF
jgi:hypothetical protein